MLFFWSFQLYKQTKMVINAISSQNYVTNLLWIEHIKLIMTYNIPIGGTRYLPISIFLMFPWGWHFKVHPNSYLKKNSNLLSYKFWGGSYYVENLTKLNMKIYHKLYLLFKDFQNCVIQVN